MTDLAELVVRWQPGWCASRGLPRGEDVGGGLRVPCEQSGRDVEYLAYDPGAVPALSALVHKEERVTWLTVPSHDPDGVAAALEASGLILLKRGEQLMTTALRDHPRAEPPEPYELRVERDGDVIRSRWCTNRALSAPATTPGNTYPA